MDSSTDDLTSIATFLSEMPSSQIQGDVTPPAKKNSETRRKGKGSSKERRSGPDSERKKARNIAEVNNGGTGVPSISRGSSAQSPSVSVIISPTIHGQSPTKSTQQSRDTPSKRKQCNCKNSKCLKLYCECFASGIFCQGCNCVGCFNNEEHKAERTGAIEATLERNPQAFRPKISQQQQAQLLQQQQMEQPGYRHSKGCHCKKSGCLKKYCECFQAGVLCSDNCKCSQCKNFENSADLLALFRPEAGMVDGVPMSPPKNVLDYSYFPLAAANAYPSANGHNVGDRVTRGHDLGLVCCVPSGWKCSGWAAKGRIKSYFRLGQTSVTNSAGFAVFPPSVPFTPVATGRVADP